MSNTTDKEQYICLNCYAVGSLNEQARCSTCDSDAVASTEQLKHIASKATVKQPRERIIPILTWYHLQCGCFETVVPYTRASNLEEALSYAKSGNCEWYMNPNGFPDSTGRIETQLLDHNGFNLWCRKRWPVDSKESEDKVEPSNEARAKDSSVSS